MSALYLCVSICVYPYINGIWIRFAAYHKTNIKSGCRIGFVDDVEIDSCNAKICRIIVYGKSRCFGIFGREEDIFINWSDIEIIGEDTILVGCDFPYQPKRKGGFLKNLFK